MPKPSSSLRTRVSRGRTILANRLRDGRSARPERLRDYDALLAQRLRHRVEVNQPLCLISQVERSGGSLLSQLLDGHPEVFAHPSELEMGVNMVGHSRKWPKLDMATQSWEQYRWIRSGGLTTHFADGYTKMPGRAEGPRYPFGLIPSLQRDLFMSLAAEAPPATQREVLNHYFTSFFNAWLDYQGLHTQPAKQWVVGFQPQVATRIKHMDRFFADYPDGRLVSSIREPASWFPSARALRRAVGSNTRFEEEDVAFEAWTRSARTAIEAMEAYGDRVLVVAFEDLLGRTAETMERVAGWLGIEFRPSLLRPTFNGMPVAANTVVRAGTNGGVNSDPLDRGRVLSDDERDRLNAKYRPLYDRVVALSRGDG